MMERKKLGKMEMSEVDFGGIDEKHEGIETVKRHERLETKPDGVKEAPKNPAIKTPYPYSVFFIIGNEFCERFSFYGMKAILPIYLTAWLRFKETNATTIIHSFNFSAYFFSLFGGILSDNYIGKFRTILYLSIIYCVGNAVMAGTSWPGITGMPPHWWGMGLGLLLIGVGTGGIKPCVASFGGDQFAASQTRQLSVFFSVFYFAINAGSVLSMYLTPLLRKVHCLGQDSCYPLAFGVPAILMGIALIVFVAGVRAYRKEAARSNVVIRFCALIGCAIFRKLFHRKPREAVVDTVYTTPSDGYWLDICRDRYEPSFIEESRQVVKVFTVFLPICIFWALYDQQGSWWVYQAVMMKNMIKVWGLDVTILPEQMGLANAVLILILIPVFSHIIYPVIQMKPLVRILLGMVLCMFSFVFASILQFIIGSRGVFAPSPTDPATMVCISGCVNILWQLPQYFIITCGEVFLSITGLEFAYSQAPTSMKSVFQAGWLLTVAGGNLVVIIVTLIDPVSWFSPANSMAWNFCLWTGIMAFGVISFAVLSYEYKYREDCLMEIVHVEADGHMVATASKTSLSSETPFLGKEELLN